MYMVCIAAYFYCTTFKAIAYTPEVVVQFVFVWRVYKRLPVLGTENNVDTVSYE
jgi:hypothetical protein